MRVLVTGGAGFIGSHIAERLIDRADELVVIDDLSTGRSENVPASATLLRMDICDQRIREAVLSVAPEAVVHCAAQPSVSASFSDPARDARTNVVGSVNVITASIAAGARRFIYVNTGGALYGHPARVPTGEDETIAPLSPYGLSKSIVESYLALLAPSPSWWASLRLANVYGPRQRPDGEAGVVAIFCDRIVRRLPVEIHGDGEQTRDFVFVGDVTLAVLAALDRPGHAVLNIGTGAPTSVNALFHAIADRVDPAASATHVAARPGDIRDSSLDPTRAGRLLGWVPTTSLADGLDATLAWHRDEVVPYS